MLDSLRVRLIARILEMPEGRLLEFERQLNQTPTDVTVAPPVDERSWPHAPLHRLGEHGSFMVTGATYQKEHYCRGAERLDIVEVKLLALAKEAGWQLEAWAVFSNHYHFIAHASAAGQPFSVWIAELHRSTSKAVNELDREPGRKCWHNYRETELTFEASYLARLNYVHQNAVRHGLVRQAHEYRWCSAGWFERTAKPAQVRTIYSFKIDRLQVADDFEPV